MSERITIRVSKEERERLEEKAKQKKQSLSALVRSSLLNKEKEEELIYREFGSIGLSRWGGRIREEFLPELRGREGVKRFREMSENDATVGAVLFAIEQSIRRINWEVRPATDSEEDLWAAKFIEECLDDMSHSFQDFISEVLTFLVFGWSYFEIVYKRRLGPDADPPSKFRDGYIGWRKFAIRAQESLFEWKFDEEGGIQGLVQVALPDYKHRFIPIEKSLLFRTKIIKNNPEGRSVLRNAYRSWFFKKCIEEIEGIGIERDLAGMPVIYLPPGFTSEAEAGSSSDEAVAKRLVRRVRRDELEGIVLPGPKADTREAAELGGWLFELLSTGGRRQFDTTEIINRYDRRIAMSVLAQWLLLGMERVGSYALSRNQSDFFLMALEGWTNSIAGVINRFAIPRLFKLNNFKMNPPKIVPAPLARPDLSDVLKVLAFLSGVGLDVSDLEDYLRNLAGLPSRPKEEPKEEEVKEKEFPGMEALIQEASEIYKESSSASEDFAIFWSRKKSLPPEASQLVLKEALLFSLAQLSRERGGFSFLSADDFRNAIKSSERLVKEYLLKEETGAL